MRDIYKWLRRNWVLVVVITAIGLLVTKRGATNNLALENQQINRALQVSGQPSFFGGESESSIRTDSSVPANEGISESEDRLVIENSSLSLLVDDVDTDATTIQRVAEEVGGFLVSRNIKQPEGAASGTVIVRVPIEKRDEVMDRYGGLSVRVISESVVGNDVTDSFENIEAKLEVMNKTKVKFEALLDRATTVQEILQVQRELTNLQRQIDGLQGRTDYLQKAARLTKITVYLSTDELALPYSPDEVWRPTVVFKEAVRSLIRALRDVGSGLIWLGVFLPIWGGLLAIIWIAKRWMKRK